MKDEGILQAHLVGRMSTHWGEIATRHSGFFSSFTNCHA